MLRHRALCAYIMEEEVFIKFEDVEGAAYEPIRDMLGDKLAQLKACFKTCKELHEYPPTDLLTLRVDELLHDAANLKGSRIDAVPIALTCALEDAVHPNRMARLMIAAENNPHVNWLSIVPQVRSRSSDEGPIELLEPARDMAWFTAVARTSLMRRLMYATASAHIMTYVSATFERQEEGHELFRFNHTYYASLTLDETKAFQMDERAFYVGTGLLNWKMKCSEMRDGLLLGEMQNMPAHVKRVHEIINSGLVTPNDFANMLRTNQVVHGLIAQMTWLEIINIVHFTMGQMCVHLMAVPGKVPEMEARLAEAVTFKDVRRKWADARSMLYMKVETATEVDPSMYKRLIMGPDPFQNKEVMAAFKIEEPRGICLDSDVSVEDFKVHDRLSVKIGCFTVSHVATQQELVELVEEHARFLLDHREGLIMCEAHVEALVEHFRSVPVADIKITKLLQYA